VNAIPADAESTGKWNELGEPAQPSDDSPAACGGRDRTGVGEEFRASGTEPPPGNASSHVSVVGTGVLVDRPSTVAAVGV